MNAQGTALLQIEAYLEGKKIYFSSHIYLKPEQWDGRKQVIVKHPHAEQLNYMLIEFLLNLERKELDGWKNGHEITLDLLRNRSNSRGNASSFLQFIKESIYTSSAKESTKKNRMTTWFLLTKFRPGLTFKEVNSRFVFDFEHYLVNKGLQTNTVAKHMKHLKAFVNQAIDQGELRADEYPFHRYRVKTKEYKHSFLLPEEVEKLEELSIPDRHITLRHSLDAFLFCCYTGLPLPICVRKTLSESVINPRLFSNQSRPAQR